MLNDPFAGGSHLPDITLVTPLALDGEIVRTLHARPPLGRRRDRARLDAGRLDVDLAGGPDRAAGAARRGEVRA
jgi:hypothetical protein